MQFYTESDPNLALSELILMRERHPLDHGRLQLWEGVWARAFSRQMVDPMAVCLVLAGRVVRAGIRS